MAHANPQAETEAAAWQHCTLGQALARAVGRWGEHELLVFPDRRLRTREFADEAGRFARGLLRLGVERGDHVAVWLPNLPETCVAELAIARLGAAMVAINTRYKTSELEYVLRQSDSTTLLVMRQLLNVDFLKVLHEVLPELGSCTPGDARCAAAPRLRCVIVVGEPQPGILSYRQVLAMGDAPELTSALAARESEVRAEDVVLLQYTSGTTAFPKAVMLAHGQVLRNAAQMAVRAGIGEDDRVLSLMPMFHVGGSVCALLGSVTQGPALYTAPVFDAAWTLETIEREQITTFIGLESMFLAIRNHPDFARRSRASLRKGWAAGTSSLLRMVAEEIGIRDLCPLYGLSEASPNVCITDWRDPYEKRLHTMGRPQPGTEVKIIHAEAGESLPPFQRGEICVRGYSVMKGYYNQPEETAGTVDADGWLHTGDLGELDADGYLIWRGRLKDTLRVGGENVSTLEVENFLCTHPAVRAAAVVGMPDERLGEVPLAFVQLREGAKAAEEEIIAWAKPRIAGFKVPRYVRFVAEFEMTGSGKIQKYVMRERALTELGKS